MTMKRVTVSVEDEMHKNLALAADLQDISLGELMRRASDKAARVYLRSDEGRLAARRKAKQFRDVASDG